jgi:alpha-tubulin suppressor-like RCC1 family protein
MNIGKYLVLVGLSLIVACTNPPEPSAPPTVTLTASQLNPAFGSNVTFTATTTLSGQIVKLELLEGTTVLKTVSNVATLEQSELMGVAGKRSFTARVTNTAGVVASRAVLEVNTKAIVANANSVVQVGLGSAHTCVLLSNGDVRCWGRGTVGRLGLGNTNSIGDNEAITSVSPIKFPTGFKVKQIAVGGSHTCALSEEGKVICWGGNSSGQLGYGDITDRGDTPETTPDKLGFVGLPPVKSIVSGTSASHICAILVSGEVRCWGRNDVGQLGLGNTNNVGDAPNEIENTSAINLGASPVKQIAVGSTHTCALLEDGILRCWGRNGSGELGFGTFIVNNLNVFIFGDDAGETPNTIAVPITDAIQISLGATHTCVITTGKKVRCWGNNADGQLGYGNTNNIGDNELLETAGFVNLGADVQQLGLGLNHSCVLLENSTIKCWGDSSVGQLGYGNTNDIGDSELPNDVGTVQVSDATQGKVIKLFSGGSHNCVLFESGNITCWGLGSDGQLGYGNTNNIGDNEFPSSVGVVPLF